MAVRRRKKGQGEEKDEPNKDSSLAKQAGSGSSSSSITSTNNNHHGVTTTSSSATSAAVAAARQGRKARAAFRKWRLPVLLVPIVVVFLVSVILIVYWDHRYSSLKNDSGASSSSTARSLSTEEPPRSKPSTHPTPTPTDQHTETAPTAVPDATTLSSSSAAAAAAADEQQQERPKFTGMGTFQVLESIPHDTTAFTQGLFLLSNRSHFVESTGMYGVSQVRKLSAIDGTVVQAMDLAPQYFGEGMAYFEVDNDNAEDNHHPGRRKLGRLIQLTWKERTGFVYDSDTLQVLNTFNFNTYTGEGWGITHIPASASDIGFDEDDASNNNDKNGEFIVTDGSHFLQRWDFSTLREKIERRRPVTLFRRDMDQAAEIRSINELEWDKFQPDTVLANVWMQDVVVRIDIHTGFIRTVYDLQTLFPKRPKGTDVLNGIALTDEPNVIWVTGKYWPKMYRIRLLDPSIV